MPTYGSGPGIILSSKGVYHTGGYGLVVGRLLEKDKGILSRRGAEGMPHAHNRDMKLVLDLTSTIY